MVGFTQGLKTIKEASYHSSYIPGTMAATHMLYRALAMAARSASEANNVVKGVLNEKVRGSTGEAGRLNGSGSGRYGNQQVLF